MFLAGKRNILALCTLNSYLKRTLLISALQLILFSCFSQIGGTRSYRFLDIPMTARSAALGGQMVSIWGEDVNLIYSNPSLLNKYMSRQATFNICNYVGDLKYGYLAYAHDLKKYGTVAGSIQFFNYGKFNGYDEAGEPSKNFDANDYSINLHYSKAFEDTSFQVGVALKTLISQYDIYQSYGNAIDFGVTWHNSKNLVLSIQAKNIGYIWKSYSNLLQEKEPLPQDVQLGLSYKVPKAPFRLIATYDQLTRWNLKYISALDTTGKSNPFNATTEVQKKDSTGWKKFSKRFGSQGDNFLRHIVVGTEIVLTKNFNIRIAYNYRRQREMILPERRGANGLSIGFGFNIKRFGFAYSFNKMAAAGNSSIFSFTYRI